MELEQMLLHAISWGMQHVYTANKEAQDVLKNEELSEQDKINLLSGPNGIDYRLLNLILMLKPLRDFAEAKFPDHAHFFVWFDDRMKHIEDNKLVDGPCQCRGCKPTNDLPS